ncbi:unnamed protein product [Cylindrotheca closterium]|uniref:Sulfotransferase domain-containing protein n=1 Tax=Cylindrotheca closterium TaxID=2856 RepID=A0AAD2JMZ3_9STRA|nr:unnamed protein product [Cylindrotheca closterium]
METRRRILSPSSPATAIDEEELNKADKPNKASSWQRISRIFVLLSSVLLLVTLQQGLTPELMTEHEVQEPSSSSSSSTSHTSPPTTFGRCTNLKYTSPKVPHKPIWIASYPGSGSEMVRDLVQALTGGLVGGSVYIKRDPPHQDCVSSKAATCKTHWPLLPIHSPLLNPQDYHSNAILLIRNPIHAFPSRLNHLWEVQTTTQAHTTQAPEQAWNRWIHKNWKQQVKTYQELIQTWTQRIQTKDNNNNNNNRNDTSSSFPYRVQLVLAYEELTNSTTITSISTTGKSTNNMPTGAMAAKGLVTLLQQANARVVIGDESIACLWRHVVLDRPRKKRSEHAYTPGYTQLLKDRILTMIQTLMERLEHQVELEDQTTLQADLTRLLQRYSQDIQRNTRIIEEI